MSEFDDLRAGFKGEFAAVGFWVPVRMTSLDSPPTVIDTYAAYRRPDVLMVNGSLSSEHRIEYVNDDLPDLAEGCLIDLLDSAGDPISGQHFRIRSVPFVADNMNITGDESGYFMHAFLTKIP